MEISHILPENERNKFPNPRGQLDPGVRMTESRVVLMNNLAKHILFTMRDLKSKMTVKTMLTIITRDITGIDNFLFGQPVQGSNGSVGQLFEKFLPVTLQLLANDGFIKLSDAAQFEAREIVKYHATAVPEFRSGKFQL